MELETAYFILVAKCNTGIGHFSEREALRAIRAEIDRRKCECGRFKKVIYQCSSCDRESG